MFKESITPNRRGLFTYSVDTPTTSYYVVAGNSEEALKLTGAGRGAKVTQLSNSAPAFYQSSQLVTTQHRLGKG